MFGSMPSTIEHIKTGKLPALAVTTPIRSGALPEVPSVSEVFPGYEASTWYGVGAPKKTPRAIVEKLNTEINAALADPKLKSRFAELGAEPISTP
jgi:tripartite-type tricarboxylate transporter receptor subunit TctC